MEETVTETYWGSSLITTKGKQLREAIKLAKRECQSTGTSTCRPTDLNKIPDLSDFFVLKGMTDNYISTEETYHLL